MLIVCLVYVFSELEKVPSTASVLVRKDFDISRNLRKAPGGKKLQSPTILGEDKTDIRKRIKKSFFFLFLYFQEELLSGGPPTLQCRPATYF